MIGPLQHHHRGLPLSLCDVSITENRAEENSVPTEVLYKERPKRAASGERKNLSFVG